MLRTHHVRRRSLLAVPVYLTLIAVPVAAQHHPDWHHGSHHHWSQAAPFYDARTEVRLTGVVEALAYATQRDFSSCGPGGGTFLTFKTATESIDVHLGSTAFLTSKNVSLAAGDELEILGSRVVIRGESLLLAREITKGDATWTLRDASGRPLWSGGCW
jgi:hypothetical protein